VLQKTSAFSFSSSFNPLGANVITNLGGSPPKTRITSIGITKPGKLTTPVVNAVLGTIGFSVKNVAAAEYLDCVEVEVDFSNGNVDFVLDKLALVTDFRGHQDTEGAAILVDDASAVRGTYMYPTSSSIMSTFNKGVLDGTTHTTSLTLRRVKAQGVITVGTSEKTCVVDDPAIATIAANCASITVGETHTAGGIATFTATDTVTGDVRVARMQIIFPTNVQGRVLDSVLDQQKDVLAAGCGAGSVQYQTTHYQLIADWVFADLSVVTTDVTRLFRDGSSRVTSGNVAVVTVGTNVNLISSPITAAGSASTTVNFKVGGNANAVQVPITVDSAIKRPFSLHVSLIKSISTVLQDGSTVDVEDETIQRTIKTTLATKLTAEGAVAKIIVHKVFDDPLAIVSVEQVLDENLLTCTSLEPSSVELDFSGGFPVAVVPFAGLNHCGIAVECEFMDCGSPVADTLGRGGAQVVLPPPTSVSVSTTASKLSDTGDSATFSPINKPTSATITIRVFFETGPSKLFDLNDPRLQVSITAGAALISLDVSGTNPVITSLNTDTLGGWTVTASFVPAFTSLTGSVSGTMVLFSNFIVSSTFYPTPTNFASTTIKEIGCTGEYQSKKLTNKAVLTDGGQFTVTQQTTWSSTFAHVTITSGGTRGVVQSSIVDGNDAGLFGTIGVGYAFGNAADAVTAASETFTLTLSQTPALATQVDYLTTFSPNTFSGLLSTPPTKVCTIFTSNSHL